MGDTPLVDRLLESLAEFKELAEQTRGQLLEVGGSARPVQAGLPPARGSRLSVRELQVLQLLADGMSDREMGAELNVSVETVRSHLKRLRRKLGAINRTTAVARGLRRGLIT